MFLLEVRRLPQANLRLLTSVQIGLRLHVETLDNQMIHGECFQAALYSVHKQALVSHNH